MRKTNESPAPAVILLGSAAAGLAATLMLMLLGAALVQRGVLAEGAIGPCALIFLIVGGALAAFLAAKRIPSGKFLWALGAGALVFAVLLAVTVLVLQQPVHPLRAAVSFACVAVASSLGGFAGASMRPKKQYRHLKK